MHIYTHRYIHRCYFYIGKEELYLAGKHHTNPRNQLKDTKTTLYYKWIVYSKVIHKEKQNFYNSEINMLSLEHFLYGSVPCTCKLL